MNKQQKDEKAWLFGNLHQLTVVSPCTIGNGIVCLSHKQMEDFIHLAEKSDKTLCFFIPASGMGSRMFETLVKAINENQIEHPTILNWVRNFHKFPFLEELIKDGRTDPIHALQNLLRQRNQGLFNLPKGAIPFHRYSDVGVLTPFQEHLIQGASLSNQQVHVHFTVQEEKKEEIEEMLSTFILNTSLNCRFSLSVQNQATDAFVFSADGSPFLNNGAWLRRPAGHGALLENMNAIDEEIVLLRNIDNIPHQHHARLVNDWWRILIGCLLQVKQELDSASQKPVKKVLLNLQSKYNLYSSEEIAYCKNEKDILELLKRPLRICGMVKNQGQPGGGPFWVKHPTGVSKQIVEGAQLVGLENEQQLLSESSHFNPVMIALHRNEWNEKSFNFTDHLDVSGGMKIKRQFEGKDIVFRERPGLWNEGMAHWNTVFVEIPESIFTPVKNVFDLLSPAHQGF